MGKRSLKKEPALHAVLHVGVGKRFGPVDSVEHDFRINVALLVVELSVS